MTPGERRAFDTLVKLRVAHGISPTLLEMAAEIAPKAPPEAIDVSKWLHGLQEKGWVQKMKIQKRQWVPTWEARMVEKHGEILYLLRMLANHDSSAEGILRFIEGDVPV